MKTEHGIMDNIKTNKKIKSKIDSTSNDIENKSKKTNEYTPQ